MPYKFYLPADMVHSLWRMKTHFGGGSIIGQIRDAVTVYLKDQEKRFGCPLDELAEALDRQDEEQDIPVIEEYLNPEK